MAVLFSVAFLLAGKRCKLEQKNTIRKWITLLRANQIVCITSTFKIDVINQEIHLIRCCLSLVFHFYWTTRRFLRHTIWGKNYSGEACLRYFCIAVIQLLRVLSFDKPCLNWSSSLKKISIQINIPTQHFSLFFLKSIWIILWVRFCYRIIIYGKEHSGMRIILRHLLSERNKITPLRRCEFLRGYETN